jgi:hypothetical protein
MVTDHQISKVTLGKTLIAIPALVALLVLPVTANVAPDPYALSVRHSSIASISSPPQGMRFESEGLQWSNPVDVFLPLPLSNESAHSMGIPRLASVLQIKGFRYKRPPPLS